MFVPYASIIYTTHTHSLPRSRDFDYFILNTREKKKINRILEIVN